MQADHNAVPNLHYLELLSNQYPNRVAAFTEIINLQAILQLPKGTEHFVSDLHGEYEAFCHIMNNCSGVIRDKVEELFDISSDEKASLCTLIYYPQDVLLLTKEQMGDSEYQIWLKTKLKQLIVLGKYLSAKYTRSKVRKALNPEYGYIIDELLHAQEGESNSRALYHDSILNTILATKTAHHFVRAMCALIKRLAVDHLHVVGDVYDRGPHPDRIMAMLMDYHSLDVEWGNHDALWMGAALGSEVCIATVLRNNINYFNCNLLESGYGISLRKLNDFALHTYLGPVKGCALSKEEQVTMQNEQANASHCKPSISNSALQAFEESIGAVSLDHEYELMAARYADEKRAKMVKAITVIALKLQGQLIKRNPEFGMDDRLLLDKMDLSKGIVTIDGVEYQLNTVDLPTIDPADPFALTREEQEIVLSLKHSFLESKALQKEVSFLFSHGSIYKVFNGNLLYHGCVPMTEDGEFKEIACHGKLLKGKAFMDHCEQVARHAYAERDQRSLDFMYFLWCGVNSPLSGRVMKPFERYFLDDKRTHHEPRNPYYTHYHEEWACRKILSEFGLNPDTGHIINGHTPIKVKEGESPVRGNGKLYVIDGGLCQAYHRTTGIAGYTLIFSSHGMVLKAHKAFESRQKAIHERVDILSDAHEVEHYNQRLKVANSDNGKRLQQNIVELQALLDAYRNGIIAER